MAVTNDLTIYAQNDCYGNMVTISGVPNGTNGISPGYLGSYTGEPWGYGQQYNPPQPWTYHNSIFPPSPNQVAPYVSSPPNYQQPCSSDDLLRAYMNLHQTSTPQKETPLNYRGLFEVFAVCLLDDEVYIATIAAKDEDSARLKAFKVLELNDPDEFTFLVRRIGDLPGRKEVQKVRIVPDGE